MQIIKLFRKTKLFGLVKNIYRSVNFRYNINLNGKALKALKIYHTKTENSERWMGELLRIIFNIKKGTFIDVGANIGQTLFQVKSIDWDRNYIGFEPNPACNMFLQELMKVNNFVNVNLFPVGLYTENSIKTLYLYDDDITNSGGSIVDGYWDCRGFKPQRTMMVPLMTYETIAKISHIDNIAVLKIDVEGSELEVLQTLEKQITQFRPIIIIEILSALSEENKLRVNSQESILKFITEKNYLIYRVIVDSGQHLDSIMPIKYFDPYFDKNQCNYLFLPVELAQEVAAQFSVSESQN